MSKSPQREHEAEGLSGSADSGSNTGRKPLSAPMLIFVTALDTTWRMFLPIIGGVFAGIGLDHLFNLAPIFTVVFLILGVVISGYLIVTQLRKVRSYIKK